MYIINEASTSSKKYKCPYCDYSDERIKLVSHVDKKHQDMIPEGFTAARVVFNHINKKTHGTCIQCGQETKWNENTWKYERLCGSKKCHDEYVKLVRSRMMSKYNTTTLLNDPEHQKKMLAGRKISGTYKFKDGGKKEYCGTYERKLLEFYDKVLNVKSDEIMTPGPTIKYMYDGEEHFWITDLYYITANLVHDVKDGGNNPNTRPMDSYRNKQIEKEAAIAELNKYNYIRLTDNNFRQLLHILAEIKEQMLDPDSNEYKIHINETVGGLPPANYNDVYVVQYLNNDVFVKDAIAINKELDEIYELDDNGNIIKKSFLDIDNEFTLFKTSINYDIRKKLESIKENTFNLDPNFFYKLISGKNVLSHDQICYDNSFTEVMKFYDEELIKNKINIATYDINKIKYTGIPVHVNENYDNIQILSCESGYYASNGKYSSAIYNNIEDIPLMEMEVLSKIKED